MRVSNQLMADKIKANIFRLSEQLVKSEERVATGKRINRLSDDPVGIGRVLAYRKSISSMNQYTENISDGKLHIDTIENILDTVTTFLSQAKDIAFDPSPDMRDSLAQQVATIREQILQMANTQINGNYVFAGDLTDTRPFDDTGVYAGDNGSKEYIIGDNIRVGLEADGSRIFQGAGNVFAVLESLQTALENDDVQAIEDQIQPLSDAMDQIETVRVENAGLYKRLEATETHYANLTLNFQNLMSQTEDADMAESIIDLKVQQTAYESTLAASALIINKSLLDYLG